ncbi:hypothetical protein DPMN_073839 [Dreissena polymorpha]|uniref:Uncharacterized protein n=1 Tax=Dreissena polymorpha TaxID=45954 RepID=A0A9D4BZR1_DREPO|nr:hypothetical protein DPMN_073839 [Dreissena polymorpha]
MERHPGMTLPTFNARRQQPGPGPVRYCRCNLPTTQSRPDELSPDLNDAFPLHHIHRQMNQKLQYSNRWDTAFLQHQNHVLVLQASQVDHQKTTIQ